MELLDFERRFEPQNLHVVSHVFDPRTDFDWESAITDVNARSYTREDCVYTIGFVQVLLGYTVEHYRLHNNDRLSYDIIKYIC